MLQQIEQRVAQGDRVGQHRHGLRSVEHRHHVAPLALGLEQVERAAHGFGGVVHLEAMLLGNGAGGFGAKTDFATDAFPVSVAIGDVSGNGLPDLVVANANSATVSVLLGDGAGGFGAKTDFATGRSPVSVAIGDVNSDGVPPVAGADASGLFVASPVPVGVASAPIAFERLVVVDAG